MLQGRYVKFKLLLKWSLHNRLVRRAGVEGEVVAVEEVVGSPLTQNLLFLVTRQVWIPQKKPRGLRPQTMGMKALISLRGKFLLSLLLCHLLMRLWALIKTVLWKMMFNQPNWGAVGAAFVKQVVALAKIRPFDQEAQTSVQQVRQQQQQQQRQRPKQSRRQLKPKPQPIRGIRSHWAGGGAGAGLSLNEKIWDDAILSKHDGNHHHYALGDSKLVGRFALCFDVKWYHTSRVAVIYKTYLWSFHFIVFWAKPTIWWLDNIEGLSVVQWSILLEWG